MNQPIHLHNNEIRLGETEIVSQKLVFAVEMLAAEKLRLERLVESLQKRNERLMDALAHYADEENWDAHLYSCDEYLPEQHGCQVAQEAIEGEKETEV